MPKSERLVPRALELLTQALDDEEQTVAELRLNFGDVVSASDGDGYHDGMANLLENQKLMAEGQLYKLRELVKNSGILEKPDQTDIVQCGHEVEVEIEYSPDDIEKLMVVLLDTGNIVLSKELEEQKMHLVSPESPLGSAILGCKLDQISTMKQVGAKVKITGIRIPSNLFLYP